MGYYINPPNETKEEFLKRVMVAADTHPTWPPPEGTGYVCLVSNVAFTAAAIAYNKCEFDEFNDPRDMRPKVWLTVPNEDLAPYLPEVPI